MADTKITALTALTAADPINDVIPIVDVSDTSMAASGTTKKISVNNILGASGTATLASATITGAATVGTTLGVTGVSTFAAGSVSLPALTTTGDTNTGIYYPAADTFAVTTGGTESHRANSTGLIRGATTADIVAAETTTLTNIGNIGASHGASTGTYFVAKVNAANGIVELKADARSGAYPPMVFTVSAAEGLRLNANAALVLKGGTTTANGVGVAFPATQVASTDANTLDDYEEGTWTGTLTGGGSNPTVPVVVTTGRYTKIGRQVYVTINFNLVNTTGASGGVSITGLPFANNASNTAQGSILSSDTLTFTGSPIAFLELSSTTLNIYQILSNAAVQFCTHNAGVGRYMQATITYSV